MRPETVERVQASFPRVAAMAPEAARLFYARLFEIDPGAARLFERMDMQAQGQKLMATLGYIVGQLYRPERLIPAAQELARRHAAYGVALAQYDSVGSALLWTLEQGLGEAFTPELRGGWEETYALLAGVMREAAAEAA
jgi:nitric oxide dioxygenase